MFGIFDPYRTTPPFNPRGDHCAGCGADVQRIVPHFFARASQRNLSKSSRHHARRRALSAETKYYRDPPTLPVPT
jgi:hypothetical protein